MTGRHKETRAVGQKTDKRFPEAIGLDEYSDYEAKPTKANASAFITRALEENWSAVQQSEGYMSTSLLGPERND